jgi:hypothetical protein
VSNSLIAVLAIAVSLAALAASQAAAEPYATGDRIAAFTLEDQHGNAHTLDAGVALLLFNREMDGGKLIKQALETASADLLSSGRAVYISDISDMPKLVAKMFALPSMRKRPYSTWLDWDGATTNRLPSATGQATLIFLHDFEVTRVLHASTAAEITSELELLK